jgi:hypothetical protein
MDDLTYTLEYTRIGIAKVPDSEGQVSGWQWNQLTLI